MRKTMQCIVLRELKGRTEAKARESAALQQIQQDLTKDQFPPPPPNVYIAKLISGFNNSMRKTCQ